jgi:hypothetical protein
MSKSERILECFPAVYGANQPTKLLAHVVQQLAAPLEEADTLLFRIQRAHRLGVAEDGEDILRLAALLNLTRWHFEDILADEDAPYDARLARLRERVRRIAAVHLRGLGTPWAVVEAAAIFLEASIVAEPPGAPRLQRADARAFSHRATLEFGRAPGQPRARVYLHENPLRKRRVPPAERWPMGLWQAESRNVEPVPVTLVVEGIGERTVLPEILCATTGESVRFHGVVPAGKALVLAEDGATLDGWPVDEWIVRGSGATYELGAWDDATVGVESAPPPPAFAGDPATLAPTEFRRRHEPMLVPAGCSEWFFRVAEGVWGRSDFDFAVFATSRDLIGAWDRDNDFDACVYDFPASGVAGMAWGERIPCAFKLVLPANTPKPPKPPVPAPATTTAESAAAVWAPPDAGRMANVIPRFRAAGIRAFVAVGADAWVLGESVLRGADAAKGEGIDFHATRLHDAAAELYVPFDPET